MMSPITAADSIQPEEVELLLPFGRIAGLRWAAQEADSSPARVIALHGWLDNAASFAPLAQHLTGVELVALDFPGHGRSDWRQPGSYYHYPDYLWPILDAADALGWDQYHLLGHSMGASVASVLAAVQPERVLSLSLIEGLGPMATNESHTASLLRSALTERNDYLKRKKRVFKSPDQAVAARAKAGDLSTAAAEILIERALKKIDGGWEWSSDPRLRRSSLVRLTEAQVANLLENLNTPSLLIAAEPFNRIMQATADAGRIERVKGLKLRTFQGSHHLHMEKPQQLAPVILHHIHQHQDHR